MNLVGGYSTETFYGLFRAAGEEQHVYLRVGKLAQPPINSLMSAKLESETDIY